MKQATSLIHSQTPQHDPYAASAPPIYQTSTFVQEGAGINGPYDYSRSGNPTRTLVEDKIAHLEGGCDAFAFSSGMAAITAVTRLLCAGDEIVAGDDLYGGSCRLLSTILPQFGIKVHYADTTSLESFAAALTDKTRMVLLETPSNPFQKISDIEQIAALSHEVGALLVVDNTLMTPLLQKPLQYGADLVVHSATKYLSGHSDVTAGVVVAKDPALAARIGFVQNAEGAGLAPMSAWLLLRGIKTLSLRLERQQQNATALAHFLQTQPGVTDVFFPGLKTHPGAEVHDKQASGAGAVISFRVKDEALASHVVAMTRLFQTSVSFGSVCSLISLPSTMSHASIPEGESQKQSIPQQVVRLSVGIEDLEDLVADLEQAFASAEVSAHEGLTEALCSEGGREPVGAAVLGLGLVTQPVVELGRDLF